MLSLQKTIRAINILQRSKKSFINVYDRQTIWGYVAIAFNRVDTNRLQKVGPDRLCAEWVIKNGGAIRTVELPGFLLRDYNALPPESTKFHIKTIDATGASIMKIGFEHFKGCDHIIEVILRDCKHLEEDGLEGLKFLRTTLLDLEISGCYNITDEGLKVIGELNLLEKLRIFDMLYVKNLDAVVKELQSQLPGCKIVTK